MPLKRFKSDLPNVYILCLTYHIHAERLAVINLEPLKLRRLKNDLVMYFKCLNTLVALTSDEYFCQKIMLFILDLVVVDL